VTSPVSSPLSEDVPSSDVAAPPDPAAAAPGRRSGALADAAFVLGVLAGLGVLCGVLWWLLVTPAEFTRVASGGGEMGEVDLGRRFGADGWYATLAALAGLPAGFALTWWRARDYLLTAGLLVVGACVAAGLSLGVGYLLGPPKPDAVLAHAAAGVRVPVQLTLQAHTALLVWPLAVLLGSLVVLLSKPLGEHD